MHIRSNVHHNLNDNGNYAKFAPPPNKGTKEVRVVVVVVVAKAGRSKGQAISPPIRSFLLTSALTSDRGVNLGSAPKHLLLEVYFLLTDQTLSRHMLCTQP